MKSRLLAAFLAVLHLTACPPPEKEEDGHGGDAGLVVDAGRETLDASSPGPDAGTGADAATGEDGAVLLPDAGDTVADAGEGPMIDSPAVKIHLGSTRVGVGETVPLQWEVAARGHDAQLFIVARDPAGAPPGLYPDMVPGGGYACGGSHWLKADGSWSDAEVAFGPAAGGQTTLSLPPSVDGRWRIGAYLRKTAGGHMMAADVAEVAVGQGPMFHLQVDRPAGTTLDVFNAHLLMEPGAQSMEVSVLAFINGPNGLRYLPGMGEDLVYAYKGPVRTASLPLLGGMLGPDTGKYVVTVRVTAAGADLPISASRAVLWVRDEDCKISGRVWNSPTGSQITGVDPSTSWVRAVSVNGGWATPPQPLAADGTYSITVGPGSYVLMAAVSLEGKRYRAMGATASNGNVVIMTGGDYATVHLYMTGEPALPVRTPPHIVVPPSLPAPSIPPAGDLASDRRPRPRVVVMPGAINEESMDPAEMAVDLVAYDIGRSTSDVSIMTAAEINALGCALALQQLSGTDDPAASLAHAFTRATYADFVLGVVTTRFERTRRLTMQLVNSKDAAVVDSRHKDQGVNIDPSWVVDEADTMDEFYRDPYPTDARGLLHFLRSFQSLPIRPVVTPALPQPRPMAGDTITATANLREAPDGPSEPGKPMVFEVERPDGSSERLEATTNHDGTASISFSVGNSPGLGTVRAGYRSGEEQTTGTINFMVIHPNTGLTMSSPVVNLRYGAAAPVRVEIREGGAVVSGARVQLRARGGMLRGISNPEALEQEAEVTLPTGQLDAEFVAGTESREGGIEAVYTPAAGSTVRGALPFIIDGLPRIALRATPEIVGNSERSEITIDLRMGNGVLPNVMVSLGSAGGGGLSSYGGHTDSTGHFASVFTAPAEGSGTTPINVLYMVDGTIHDQNVVVSWGSNPPRLPTFPGIWEGRQFHVLVEPCNPNIIPMGDCTLSISDALHGVVSCMNAGYDLHAHSYLINGRQTTLIGTDGTEYPWGDGWMIRWLEGTVYSDNVDHMKVTLTESSDGCGWYELDVWRSPGS